MAEIRAYHRPAQVVLRDDWVAPETHRQYVALRGILPAGEPVAVAHSGQHLASIARPSSARPALKGPWPETCRRDWHGRWQRAAVSIMPTMRSLIVLRGPVCWAPMSEHHDIARPPIMAISFWARPRQKSSCSEIAAGFAVISRRSIATPRCLTIYRPRASPPIWLIGWGARGARPIDHAMPD